MDKIILSEEQIQEICKRIAGEITEALKDDKKIPVFVGVLKGSLNFMMDLMKYIKFPIYNDYIQISSYEGTTSSGKIRLVKDLSFDCEGRSIVIIEDVIDTGLSMHYLIEHMKVHNPKRIYVCALFDKSYARAIDVKTDFIGVKLDHNVFLMGYGLDYNELERNVPYVYGADKEDVERLQKRLDEDKEVV